MLKRRLVLTSIECQIKSIFTCTPPSSAVRQRKTLSPRCLCVKLLLLVVVMYKHKSLSKSSRLLLILHLLHRPFLVTLIHCLAMTRPESDQHECCSSIHLRSMMMLFPPLPLYKRFLIVSAIPQKQIGVQE